VANRKRVDFPPHVRSAIAADLRLAQTIRVQAEATFKIRIHLATEQGLTTQEIADELGVSQAVVSKWRIQGEVALEQREHDA
jgi:transposase-like protein